ncbi:MAG TPA: sigma 54-interacting transcriptional regulator [Ignavibacteriaceae bacterium]|jgi:PAS domain S-box-containing protein|nr:sigma 54-interacting transcriptional regulator [Ignavibacteriaceae bacterium]HOJ17277.1 sigma 54-interacting transcriptional regulator [Ignavibacteriaceae bacterium]HPO54466.1 sigma 54-interacting transcriptional regulator [Ignavibacteriaceae bacterium]
MSEVKQIIDRSKETLVLPDGIAIINKDLNIIVFNEAASRITGFGEDDILSQSIRLLFEEHSRDLKYIRDSIANNLTFTNLSLHLTHKDSSTKPVLASLTPILKDESVISVVLIFRDTYEMLSLANEIESKTGELIEQKNRLDAIFNSNIEGTFTINNDWEITSFNKSAENITGYKKTEAIGKKCWTIFNSNICRNGCHMETTMQKGKPTIGNEVEILNKNNRKLPIKVNSAILVNNKKQIIGAVETFIDISEIKNLTSHLADTYKYENIVGKSKELQQVIHVLESVSQTNTTVLITGESGTGKELVARAIHLNSPRKNAPFIAVNCSAFAETLIESELFGHEAGAFTGASKTKTGRFELAQNGTLFLDEIGDLSLTVQTKLLRVIETLEFERVGGNKTIKMNTRIIAATNKDLNREIREGRFRADLFYRINVINIHLPPLRERRDDLPILINHFITIFNRKFSKNITSVSPEAYDILSEYPFPGNIRELENIIEHCFILCNRESICVDSLPKRLREKSADYNKNEDVSNLQKLELVERGTIIAVLKKHNGNRRKAAKELSINPSTLWRKMVKLKITDSSLN